MSVSQALIIEYADMLQHAFQQDMSVLNDKVTIKTGRGTQTAFSIINPMGVQDVTGNPASLTVWQNPDMYLRWAPHLMKHFAVLLSQYDDMSAFTELTGPYIQAGVAGHSRQIDRVLVEAALGSAVQGQTPGSVAAATFDTAAPNADGSGGNLIAGGGTGMTAAKLKSAMGYLLSRSVGVGRRGEMLPGSYVAMMTGAQMKNLLDQTDVTSWDFIGNLGPDNAPLVKGFVARYAGFDILLTDPSVLDVTASVRRCLVWHKSSMGLAVWPGSAAAGAGGGGTTTANFYVTIDRLPTHQNATGAQISAHYGAVRIQDKGVIAIDCAE